MNTHIEFILRRKSRRRFVAVAISDAQVEEALRAAMAAPTAKNVQPWHFVVVRDVQKMARMAEALPHAKMLSLASIGQ